MLLMASLPFSYTDPTWIGAIRHYALLPNEWMRATFLTLAHDAFRWLLDQNSRSPLLIAYGDSLRFSNPLWGADLRHQVFPVSPQEMIPVDCSMAVIPQKPSNRADFTVPAEE